MTDHQVLDLAALVGILRRPRIPILSVRAGPGAEEDGTFTDRRDPEGNRVELWESPSGP